MAGRIKSRTPTHSESVIDLCRERKRRYIMNDVWRAKVVAHIMQMIEDHEADEFIDIVLLGSHEGGEG